MSNEDSTKRVNAWLNAGRPAAPTVVAPPAATSVTPKALPAMSTVRSAGPVPAGDGVLRFSREDCLALYTPSLIPAQMEPPLDGVVTRDSLIPSTWSGVAWDRVWAAPAPTPSNAAAPGGEGVLERGGPFHRGGVDRPTRGDYFHKQQDRAERANERDAETFGADLVAEREEPQVGYRYPATVPAQETRFARGVSGGGGGGGEFERSQRGGEETTTRYGGGSYRGLSRGGESGGVGLEGSGGNRFGPPGFLRSGSSSTRHGGVDTAQSPSASGFGLTGYTPRGPPPGVSGGASPYARPIATTTITRSVSAGGFDRAGGGGGVEEEDDGVSTPAGGRDRSGWLGSGPVARRWNQSRLGASLKEGASGGGGEGEYAGDVGAPTPTHVLSTQQPAATQGGPTGTPQSTPHARYPGAVASSAADVADSWRSGTAASGQTGVGLAYRRAPVPGQAPYSKREGGGGLGGDALLAVGDADATWDLVGAQTSAFEREHEAARQRTPAYRDGGSSSGYDASSSAAAPQPQPQHATGSATATLPRPQEVETHSAHHATATTTSTAASPAPAPASGGQQHQQHSHHDDDDVGGALEEEEEFGSSGWYYMDPSSTAQGPFSTPDMRDWFINGYFSDELPLRYGESGPFTPLLQLLMEGVDASGRPMIDPATAHAAGSSGGADAVRALAFDHAFTSPLYPRHLPVARQAPPPAAAPAPYPHTHAVSGSHGMPAVAASHPTPTSAPLGSSLGLGAGLGLGAFGQAAPVLQGGRDIAVPGFSSLGLGASFGLPSAPGNTHSGMAVAASGSGIHPDTGLHAPVDPNALLVKITSGQAVQHQLGNQLAAAHAEYKGQLDMYSQALGQLQGLERELTDLQGMEMQCRSGLLQVQQGMQQLQNAMASGGSTPTPTQVMTMQRMQADAQRFGGGLQSVSTAISSKAGLHAQLKSSIGVMHQRLSANQQRILQAEATARSYASQLQALTAQYQGEMHASALANASASASVGASGSSKAPASLPPTNHHDVHPALPSTAHTAPSPAPAPAVARSELAGLGGTAVTSASHVSDDAASNSLKALMGVSMGVSRPVSSAMPVSSTTAHATVSSTAAGLSALGLGPTTAPTATAGQATTTSTDSYTHTAPAPAPAPMKAIAPTPVPITVPIMKPVNVPTSLPESSAAAKSALATFTTSPAPAPVVSVNAWGQGGALGSAPFSDVMKQQAAQAAEADRIERSKPASVLAAQAAAAKSAWSLPTTAGKSLKQIQAEEEAARLSREKLAPASAVAAPISTTSPSAAKHRTMADIVAGGPGHVHASTLSGAWGAQPAARR